MPSLVDDIDTTVQELRVEKHRGAFKDKLARIVSVLGAVPDLPAGDLSTAAIRRLRELMDEAIEAIEQRIDSGGDDLDTQQHLAGTVYELRRRMEIVEKWHNHEIRKP